MPHQLVLSEDCKSRLEQTQIACGKLMAEKRGVVDGETFQMLNRAYHVTGNAAREIGILVEEIMDLRIQLINKRR